MAYFLDNCLKIGDGMKYKKNGFDDNTNNANNNNAVQDLWRKIRIQRIMNRLLRTNNLDALRNANQLD